MRDSAEQADKDGDAQALKCTLMAILHHLMSIDAFIGGKRSKEQLTAAYLGIDHEMTVAGLSYGKDTAVNIQASFNTDPETVNTSLFDQIQQLLHQRYIVIKLPEDLPEDIRGQQLLVEVPITFMLDQPALIGFLGLGELLCTHNNTSGTPSHSSTPCDSSLWLHPVWAAALTHIHTHAHKDS